MSNSCYTGSFVSRFFPVVVYLKAFLSVDRPRHPSLYQLRDISSGEDQSSVSFLLSHPFLLSLTERCYEECLFYIEFSHVSSYLGGMRYKKKERKLLDEMLCFFWRLLWILFVFPEGLGHVMKVSPAIGASRPLSVALMEGYLGTRRQKSSWIYLCFLNCCGDWIFFSVFINQISSCWIISSFPWHICFK